MFPKCFSLYLVKIIPLGYVCYVFPSQTFFIPPLLILSFYAYVIQSTSNIKWGRNEPSSIFVPGSTISCCHLKVVRLVSETRHQWTSVLVIELGSTT